ncbi:MAG TPA: hypothetical protein VF192_06715 [Longimicrobiales bacterium]
MPDGRKLPNELRGEQRSLEALRARQLREEAGREAVGRVGEPSKGVLVQVCIECGKEYMSAGGEPRAGLVCEKCGSTVFRPFYTASTYDEVDADFRAATERELTPDADESDVTRADILDLNNL